MSVLHRIETNHDELIHDAQANYYGTKLATCSSDHTIKIYQLNGNQSKLLTELHGHLGAVWQLDWSHPEYENLLASCSYDKKVIIWKEEDNGHWKSIKEFKEHDASVSSIQWAPREFGLMLACASSDGSISIIKRTAHDDWEARKIPNAHSRGVNSISWAPPISSVSIFRPTSTSAPGSGDSTAPLRRPTLVKRFVSGGCDNLCKIWKYDDDRDEWVAERDLENHTDWVRDVAWAPSIGLPKTYIASCSQDKKVIIWTNNDGPDGSEWESRVLNDFNDIVWHVSWSIMGNILAISSGENQVSLWKEDISGEFRRIQNLNTT